MRVKKCVSVLILLASLFSTINVFGDVGIVEKLGQTLPADIEFLNDRGQKINFGEYIGKPTVFAPVYLKCSTACPMNLGHLAAVLGQMKLIDPGKDFQVAAISFNEKDTPELASDKKKNYMTAIGSPFPEDAWSFFVGDDKNITAFLGEVGYSVKREGDDFAHPVGLVIVSPKREIVRYFVGSSYSAIDLTMAINEAAEGRIGTTTNRILSYCFAYDASKNAYVFNFFKAAGGVVVLSLVGFAVFLFAASRKRRIEIEKMDKNVR